MRQTLVWYLIFHSVTCFHFSRILGTSEKVIPIEISQRASRLVYAPTFLSVFIGFKFTAIHFSNVSHEMFVFKTL